MMRRLGMLLVALVVAQVVARQIVRAGAEPIRLGTVVFNSPGKDTRTNASLNAEYVVVRNPTFSRQCITGWTVADLAGHVYTFRDLCLSGYGTVTLHTGRGTDTYNDRFWGSRSYIWNNDGDEVSLRNAAGSTIDHCSWPAGTAAVAC
jgi:hypothetical protein